MEELPFLIFKINVFFKRMLYFTQHLSVCVCEQEGPCQLPFYMWTRASVIKTLFLLFLLLKAYVLELRLFSKNIEAQYINLD